MGNLPRKVTHSEHQKDYDEGYETAQSDLLSDSLESYRDRLNNRFPPGQPFQSLAWYYYATGYTEGLLNSM